MSKRKNPSCEGRIEKSVPRDHRLSSLGKPCDAGDPREGFFYPTLTLMIDSYIICEVYFESFFGETDIIRSDSSVTEVNRYRCSILI